MHIGLAESKILSTPIVDSEIQPVLRPDRVASKPRQNDNGFCGVENARSVLESNVRPGCIQISMLEDAASSESAIWNEFKVNGVPYPLRRSPFSSASHVASLRGL